MGLCAEFDANYSAYNAYQQIAEKYWCLRNIAKEGLPWVGNVQVQKEGLVRFETMPLRIVVPELQQTPRGTRVEIEITRIDLLELSASVRVLEMQNPDQTQANESASTEILKPCPDPLGELPLNPHAEDVVRTVND